MDNSIKQKREELAEKFYETTNRGYIMEAFDLGVKAAFDSEAVTELLDALKFCITPHGQGFSGDFKIIREALANWEKRDE